MPPAALARAARHAAKPHTAAALRVCLTNDRGHTRALKIPASFVLRERCTQHLTNAQPV
jgi:hypothetical protein